MLTPALFWNSARRLWDLVGWGSAASYDVILSTDHVDWKISRLAARFLVGRLRRVQLATAINIFYQEQHPQVIKWLAMALARMGEISIRHLLEETDWIIASLAILPPRDEKLLRDESGSSETLINLLSKAEVAATRPAALKTGTRLT